MVPGKKPSRTDSDPSSSSSASSSSKKTDLISGLPDCLLSNIFPHLTIREAARTALLSKRWRRLWSTSPLHLDDDDLWSRTIHPHGPPPKHSPAWGLDENWRASTITRILASHRGTVRLFRVAHTRSQGRRHLFNFWFQILAQKCVQQIDFDFSFLYSLQEVPASLLACDSLKSLLLHRCRFPDTTKAPFNLTRLTELTISSVQLTEHDLGSILSRCTELQSFSFLWNFCLPRVHVRSQSLRSLTASGPTLEGLFIDDAPNLERFLGSSLGIAELAKVGSAPKLKVLGYLSMCTETFELGQTVLETILQHWANVRGTILVHTIRTLAVEVRIDCCEEIKIFTKLLRCFPRLGTLHILVISCNNPDPALLEHLELLDPIDCLDHHLKVVKFKAYNGVGCELELAKFLIAKARALSVMKFRCAATCSDSWIREQQNLLCFQNRASSNARLIFAQDDPRLWRIFNINASNLSFADPFDS